MTEVDNPIIDLLKNNYKQFETGIIVADTNLKVIWYNNAAFNKLPQVEKINDLKALLADVNWIKVTNDLKAKRPILVNVSTLSGSHIFLNMIPLIKNQKFSGVICWIMSYNIEAANKASHLIFHDMKNKILITKNACDYLKNDQTISEKQSLYLDIIRRNTSSLLNLIKDFDVIRDEISYANTLNLQNINIVEHIKNILMQSAYYLDDTIKVAFSSNESLMIIRCDPVKVEEAVLNLLMNAVRCCRDMVKVKVLKEKNKAIIEVINNGSSIPEENLSNIFTPFFTTESNRGGKGLGLYITRLIATAHGGDVEGFNIEDGVCFRITIPLDIDISDLKLQLSNHKVDSNLIKDAMETALESRRDSLFSID